MPKLILARWFGIGKRPPKEQDYISAALVRTFRFATNIPLVKFRPIMNKINDRTVKNLAKKTGIVPIPVDLPEHNVKGHWIVESELDIPTNRTDAESKLVILHIHGGYFVFGSSMSVNTSIGLVKAFNVSVQEKKMLHTRLAIFNVDYPKVPEHPYPAQRDAIISAMNYLTQVLGVRRLVLSGESAGGNCAVAVHQYLKEKSPALALLLWSPWVDLSPGNSAHPEFDFVTDKKILEAGKAYAGKLGLADPRISPANEQTICVPTGGAFVSYGGAEHLVPSIKQMIQRMQGRVVVDAPPGMPHIHVNLYLYLDGASGQKYARESIDKAVTFLIEGKV